MSASFSSQLTSPRWPDALRSLLLQTLGHGQPALIADDATVFHAEAAEGDCSGHGATFASVRSGRGVACGKPGRKMGKSLGASKRARHASPCLT